SKTSRLNLLYTVGPNPPEMTALPPIPWFSTAIWAVTSSACNRPARISGQRLSWLGIEPRPSVIESPSVTTAAAFGLLVQTSIPEIIYQRFVTAGAGIRTESTAELAEIYDVEREPGWPV